MDCSRSRDGAVVEKIYKKGAAGASILRIGNVILGVNDVPVKNAADVVDLVKILRQRGVIKLVFHVFCSVKQEDE